MTDHKHAVRALAVTIDSRYTLSASNDATIKVWDTQSGIELYTLQGHTDEVRAIVLTTDGSRAISASADRCIKLWDIENGKEIKI